MHVDWISRKIHLSVSLRLGSFFFSSICVKNTREKRHCQFVCTFGIKTTRGEKKKPAGKKNSKINTNRSWVFFISSFDVEMKNFLDEFPNTSSSANDHQSMVQCWTGNMFFFLSKAIKTVNVNIYTKCFEKWGRGMRRYVRLSWWVFLIWGFVGWEFVFLQKISGVSREKTWCKSLRVSWDEVESDSLWNKQKNS